MPLLTPPPPGPPPPAHHPPTPPPTTSTTSSLPPLTTTDAVGRVEIPVQLLVPEKERKVNFFFFIYLSSRRNTILGVVEVLLNILVQRSLLEERVAAFLFHHLHRQTPRKNK